MNEYAIKKGEEGERFVFEIVKNKLEEIGLDYRIETNAIFPFESVYGKYGYITAEIDIVVFTPFYIFLFEIKNECYRLCNYSDSLWELVNGDIVSNPLIQNNTHKKVFCSELGIPREKVITVEVLLENGKKPGISSVFINDYIFDINDCSADIKYLLASECDDKIAYEELYARFCSLLSKKYSIEDHRSILKRTGKIEKRIKNVTNHNKLHRTDVIYCPSCGNGKLFFKDSTYKSKGNKKQSMHFELGCSNFKRGCNGKLIYVDKGKSIYEFLQLNPITIEQRNGWKEECVINTALDDINELNRRLNDEKEKNKKLIKKNAVLKDENKSIKAAYDKNNEKLEKMKNKLEKFKKVVGSIYILND